MVDAGGLGGDHVVRLRNLLPHPLILPEPILILNRQVLLYVLIIRHLGIVVEGVGIVGVGS